MFDVVKYQYMLWLWIIVKRAMASSVTVRASDPPSFKRAARRRVHRLNRIRTAIERIAVRTIHAHSSNCLLALFFLLFPSYPVSGCLYCIAML
jgi:hypothetical protein